MRAATLLTRASQPAARGVNDKKRNHNTDINTDINPRHDPAHSALTERVTHPVDLGW